MTMQTLYKLVVMDRAVSFFCRLLILFILPAVILVHTESRGQGLETQATEAQLDFTLPVPVDESHKQSLGLTAEKRFSLGQIKADLVIIEIFSMYCPICQREAADVNKLYQLIQDNPGLKKRVKLIGIGAGNSEFEVNFFKDKYKIEFPLFPDGDFVIHKKINEVRTPHFFGLQMQGDNLFKVIYARTGEVSDPETFLDNLVKLSGISTEP